MEVDVAVLGGGPGGYTAAIRAAQLGAKVACIEREPELGGTCLRIGCIPTKAWVQTAFALKQAEHTFEKLGVRLGGFQLEFGKANEWKAAVVKQMTQGVASLFKANGVEWVKGTGTFKDANTIAVAGGEDVTFKSAIIATGSFPLSPPIEGLDSDRCVDSEGLLAQTEVPKRLVVLGGGIIGCEFASIFQRFGSEVTIIELMPRLVPVEDEAISAELEKSFKKQGIKLLTGTRVTKALAGATGVDIEAQTSDGKIQKLTADVLLVATGRGPVTTGLGAEDAGVKVEKGYIKVDELYRTSVPNVSAIGDVITLGVGVHPQLAHVSSAEGIVVAERIAGQDVRPINYDHVPNCTYCDPEIGSVGLTETEAKQKGYDVRVGSFPFGVLGRAKMAGESEGFVKIVADKKYDEILGVHMIGPRSTELVAEAVLALRLECTVEELVKTIHAHPTFSEAVGEAAHATHGAAIHL